MAGRWRRDRPLRIDLAQIKIRAHRQRKTHALQCNKTERPPPYWTARSEPSRRQGRHILDRMLFHFLSSGMSSGQNQPISVIATGIEPHTTAQGVKIEPRKVPATAMAASNGHIAGTGELSRSSGNASVSVLAMIWRESTSSPVTTGKLSRLAQSGSRCVTNGIRLKL